MVSVAGLEIIEHLIIIKAYTHNMSNTPRDGLVIIIGMSDPAQQPSDRLAAFIRSRKKNYLRERIVESLNSSTIPLSAEPNYAIPDELDKHIRQSDLKKSSLA